MASAARLPIVAAVAVVLAVGAAVVVVALGTWTDDELEHREQAVPLLRLWIGPDSAHHPTAFEDAEVRPDAGFFTSETRRTLYLQEPVGDLELAVVLHDPLRPTAERPGVVLLDQARHVVRFGNASGDIPYRMNLIAGDPWISLENTVDPMPCPAYATLTNATTQGPTHFGAVGVLRMSGEGAAWEVRWTGDALDTEGCPRMTMGLTHEGTWTVRAPLPEPDEPRRWR